MYKPYQLWRCMADTRRALGEPNQATWIKSKVIWPLCYYGKRDIVGYRVTDSTWVGEYGKDFNTLGAALAYIARLKS